MTPITQDANVILSFTTRTGYAGSTGHRQTMMLRAEEAASGLPLLEVQLDGDALLAMLSGHLVGSLDGIPAEIITASAAAHLGRHRCHTTVTFAKYPPQDWRATAPHQWRTPEAQAEQDTWQQQTARWAAAFAAHLGYAGDLSEHSNREGLSYGMTFWLSTAEDAADWRRYVDAEFTTWAAGNGVAWARPR